ncbi:hypothetical protein SKA34_07678 [Photobacterium sp. SKA34]|nr:hypothetical protein SKA34_07678 [Photobacterium sp. SKA34]
MALPGDTKYPNSNVVKLLLEKDIMVKAQCRLIHSYEKF